MVQLWLISFPTTINMSRGKIMVEKALKLVKASAEKENVPVTSFYLGPIDSNLENNVPVKSHKQTSKWIPNILRFLFIACLVSLLYACIPLQLAYYRKFR